jgi:hypothetical protein
MKIFFDYFTNTYFKLPKAKGRFTIGRNPSRNGHIRLPILENSKNLDDLVEEHLDDADFKKEFFQKMIVNSICETHAYVRIWDDQIKLFHAGSIGTYIKRSHSTIYVQKGGVALRDCDEIYFGQWRVDYYEGHNAKQIAILAKEYKSNGFLLNGNKRRKV